PPPAAQASPLLRACIIDADLPRARVRARLSAAGRVDPPDLAGSPGRHHHRPVEPFLRSLPENRARPAEIASASLQHIHRVLTQQCVATMKVDLLERRSTPPRRSPNAVLRRSFPRQSETGLETRLSSPLVSATS